MGPNITGVWASLDRHRETLELAFALNPEARKVVVVNGASPTNKTVAERIQTEFRSYEGRAQFSYLTGETVEDVRRQLAALDPGSIVIFSSFTSDKLGNIYTGPEVLSMIAPTSGAPIYGTSDTLMGLGIIGGKLLDFEGTGKRIGELTLRVLAGEKPEQIPQETGPSVMVVDWRELQRWRIVEGRLPPGTVVRFRQPSFWEAYKWYAFGLLAVVIVEAMLIGWLLFLRARRRQAEEENLRLARLAEAEHKRIGEIVSNVPGVVWETAIDPETQERRTTFVSDYLHKMLGYTPAEWMADTPALQKLFEGEGRKGVVRLKMPREGKLVIDDQVRGQVKEAGQEALQHGKEVAQEAGRAANDGDLPLLWGGRHNCDDSYFISAKQCK
jgi:PAS domain-containing protein